MNFRVLSWNLFHGRDFPPGPDGEGSGVPDGGFSWRWLGRPVHGDRHVRLNRDLFREFAAFLAASRWDVALLQEVPPRWAHRLAEATGADGRSTLTSRNWMRPLMSPVARLRPHLAGSWEGGSNLILVRGAIPGLEGSRPGARIVDYRHTTLTWRPERRVVSVVELECGLAIANFHASTGENAAGDVMRAARLAAGREEGKPLLFGGDFNARPRSSDVFERLEAGFDLSGVTGPGSIDHLLVRGVEVLEPATAWPAARREVPDSRSDLMIRLSDHAPVVVRIKV
ncbi:MAG TPA: endonuclease/exonuclease/phosphatase family protein [Solirubrobacterales bacterium]|nr:endonuclease/exonuclease/phosphatase family protein [Solirubrobacterales bacterium]